MCDMMCVLFYFVTLEVEDVIPFRSIFLCFILKIGDDRAREKRVVRSCSHQKMMGHSVCSINKRTEMMWMIG